MTMAVSNTHQDLLTMITKTQQESESRITMQFQRQMQIPTNQTTETNQLIKHLVGKINRNQSFHANDGVHYYRGDTNMHHQQQQQQANYHSNTQANYHDLRRTNHQGDPNKYIIQNGHRNENMYIAGGVS